MIRVGIGAVVLYLGARWYIGGRKEPRYRDVPSRVMQWRENVAGPLILCAVALALVVIGIKESIWGP